VERGECNDGNSCTSDDEECGPNTGCDAPTLRPVGYKCQDGDLCVAGDTCDAFGTCVSGSEVWECPEQTACNVCTCDPDQGCVCEGIEGDGFCGPDDLDVENGALVFDDCDDNDPLGWDRDDDGFPNLWEDDGADLNCDGAIDIPTSSFSPGPDVFVEIDHMAPGGPGDDHTPPSFDDGLLISADNDNNGVPDGMRSLRTTFEDQGVNLIVDEAGPVLPHVTVTMFGDRAPRFGAPDWVTYSELRAVHFDAAHRRGVYRYLVVGHDVDFENNDEYSGKAGLGSDKAIVGYGLEVDPAGMAKVELHEIGHTLGLEHGGFEEKNYKPNYLSVMNYGVQRLWDVREGVWRLDYSWYDHNDLDEANVDESNAFKSGSVPYARLYEATWECQLARPFPLPPVLVRVAAPVHADLPTLGPAARRIDFDCNGVLGDSGYTKDFDSGEDPQLTVHQGHADWSDLDLAFQRGNGFHGGAAASPEETRATASSWQRAQARLYPHCAVAQVPRAGASYRAPLIVWGSPTLSVGSITSMTLNGALPITTTLVDLDGDGTLDQYTRYLVDDLSALHGSATQALVSGTLADGTAIVATLAITRPTNPADADGDGIHDACDACPLNGDPSGSHVDADGCPP
jgi:hypothetical protein